MKSKIVFTIIICCLGIYTLTQHIDKGRTPIDLSIETEEKLPIDLMFMQRAYPTGEIKPSAYRNAVNWRKELQTTQRNQSNIWEFTGPLNIGGRITDIEVVSGDSDIIYVAAASGGIFRSIDNGASWQPIFDDQPMLAIGDMDISQSNPNTIVVGTGEVNAGGGSLAYDGDGVYISNDAGLTWESRGLENVGSIGKVLVDPLDPSIIYVGAMGPLFKNDTNRGVYRTTDSGATWEQVLFISDKTGIVDMVMHPTITDRLYAVAWERERTPENRDYGGDTSGIYRSDDGGDTWIELVTGLPTLGSQKGRISIDISISNPNVLYASYADAIGSVQGFYKTTTAGDNWTEINSAPITDVGFHWWFGGLFVNPEDENEVYHVGFDMQKTTDGGTTWQTTFPGVHVDQHALAFHPDDPSTVYLGNDGGLYTTTNSGTSSIKDLTLPITQFYRFYVDPSNPNKVYGGAQDNSTMRTTTGGLSDWTIINGGDGFQPLINKDNTNTIYALSQRGNLRRSLNDAASFITILGGVDPADRNNWDTPIAFDPQDNTILYYGTQRVYRSDNEGSNWTAISNDLTNGASTGNLSFGTITSIDVSPLNSAIIYTGADDGSVWRTLDGGATWTSVSTPLPDRWVTRVQASPNDMNTVYVTFSGYRFGENTGHVYESTNNGTEWVDISTSLPDIPVNDIEIDTFNNLFLGTDIGVLSSTDGGATWVPIGDNLPSVVVTDLHIDEGSEFLYAGTYGRSSYRLDISTDVLTTDDFALSENSVNIYPNPAIDKLTIDFKEYKGVGEVRIYTLLGQLQKVVSIRDKKQIIFVNDLPKGMYIVQVNNGERSFSQRLIKN